MKSPLQLVALTLGAVSLFHAAPLQALPTNTYTTPYTISTMGGIISSQGSADGTGVGASFNRPQGVAVDGDGNTYVVDSSNNTIRMIDTNGVVTTIAGTAGLTGRTDGFNGNARFNGPWGIAVDASTNLYVTDEVNNTVRKISQVPSSTFVVIPVLTQTNTATATNTITVTVTNVVSGTNTLTTNSTSGTNTSVQSRLMISSNWSTSNNIVATNYWLVSTLAGSAQGSTNGTNATARFNAPEGIALDGNANIYVADSGNETIRFITPSGVVTTLAGATGVSGSSDGTGTNALFNQPRGIALDANTNIYVVDSGNETIRSITSGGVVTTFAGAAGVSGNVNGTGVNARFNQPTGISVNGSTNLYVTDSGNYTIRAITGGGAVTTFAGTGSSGNANGTGINASFDLLSGVAVNTNGTVVVADSGTDRIRQITSNAAVSTLAGNGLFQPFGVVVDAKTNIYISDSGNNLIRQLDTNGVMTILAGQAGVNGSSNGTGTNALFNQPLGLALDGKTNIYVTDSGNNTVRKIAPAVVTLVGPTNVLQYLTTNATTNIITITNTILITNTLVGTNSTFTTNFISTTNSLVVGTNVMSTNWIATNTIASINWVVTTLAGQAGFAGTNNGIGTNATLNQPDGLTVDGHTNLYVADTGNNTIRKITPSSTNWVVTTPVGLGGVAGTNNGTGTNARFNSPEGVTVDGSTNLYVADTGNNTIRKVTHSGTNWVVTAFAGAAGVSGSTDGTGTNANFSTPFGIVVDGAGSLYLSDSGNQTLRKISPNAVVTTLAGSPGVAGDANGTGSNASFYQPTGMALDKATNLYVADVNNNEIRKGVAATSPTKTQNIRFQAIPKQTYTGTNVLILTATATSGLPVTFTSADTSIATVASNVLTVTGAGTILITASQDGNSVYKPAPTTSQLLVVFKGNQTLMMAPLPSTNLTYGVTIPLIVTNSSDAPVTFTSSNTNVVIGGNGSTLVTNGISISSNTATIVQSNGYATITATAGNANYNTTSVHRVLIFTNVAVGSQSISFTSPTNNSSVTYSHGFTIPLVATSSSGLTVSFASSNTNVLTISGTIATLIGSGTATIVATQAGNSDYSAATPVTNSLNVASAAQTISFNSPTNGTSLTYSNGGTIPLDATSDSGLPVSFTSANTNVLTISGTNAIMIGAGTAKIIATQSGNSSFGAATPVTNSVTLTKALQTISFTSPTNNTTNVFSTNGTIPLVASSSSGLPVSFTSANTKVLKISGTNAIMVGLGTTTITAFQTGNTNYATAIPVTNSVSLMNAQTISFTSPTNNTSRLFTTGGTIPLVATASSGLAVSFASGNSNVLTISGTNATMIGSGTATIIATQAGGANGGTNYIAATPVTNTVIVTNAPQTISFTSPTNNSSATYTNGGIIHLVGTASSGLPVSFASGNSNVLTISGTNATMIGAGTTTIIATQAGGSNGTTNYNAAIPVTNTFVLNRSAQTISFTSPTNNTVMTFTGGSFPLVATASSGLTVSFASGNSNVLTISGSTATMIGTGTATITASQSGNANYTAAPSLTNTVILQ